MSPSSTRFLAAVVLCLCGAIFGAGPAVAAVPQAPDTWTRLTSLPDATGGPVLALAVDPANPLQVLAGTSAGTVYRSLDAGASWAAVHRDPGHYVLVLAFDPLRPGTVLAGTSGDGLWTSADGGATWQQAPGTKGRSVRSLGFARGLVLAGTDHGALLSRPGSPWSAIAGLDQLSIAAVAVPAVNDPVRLVIGADATGGAEPLPLYSSANSGQSWAAVQGAVGGSSVVSALAAGPLADGQRTRQLLMGTNAGIFQSGDLGASWQAVPGGSQLPQTDVSGIVFAGNRADHFYVSSDGGASDTGGLWTTTDGGAHLSSLVSPVPSVTALAVSTESQPLVYTATFRPADQNVALWAYRDTAAAPHGPAAAVPPPAEKAAGGRSPAVRSVTGLSPRQLLAGVMRGPEAPWIVLGGVAVAVLGLAMLAYLRRTRGL
ncbi:MAG: hypothetical protein M3024_03750 [Candidatus Dormibacteraeota bacterium]|nr:hypothetical protein [Candidatus Dormibacteraeota bacterium]